MKVSILLLMGWQVADVIKSFWKSHKSATEPLCDEERHNCCQQCQDKHIVVSCCSYIVVKICRVGKSTPYLLSYQQCSEQHFRGLQKTQISHLFSALTKWWMIMLMIMMMIASKGVADDVYWQDGVEHLELSVQWVPDLQVTNRLDATN